MDGTSSDSLMQGINPKCSICNEVKGLASGVPWASYSRIVESGAHVVAESDAFIVVPSVGALNETHVLIVPRRHVNNIASLSQSEFKELKWIKASLVTFGKDTLEKKLIFFEHGAGTEVDSSGSCVEHAHLHVIAAVSGLRELLEEHRHFVNLPSFEAVAEVANTKQGYAILQDQDDSVAIANVPNMAPQLFRRLYSQIQKSPDVWNWRIDPRLDEMRRVIAKYETFGLHREKVA